MANRKSASQKTAGGGASRSANLKPANKNISSNQPSAPKAQTHTSPKPQQPPPAANRPTNRTKPQGTGNGPPKSQGSAGASWFFGGGKAQIPDEHIRAYAFLSLVFQSLAEATSGHKTSQDRSMSQAAPKHTGNGSNNLQKAQGQLLHTDNLSLKPKTPKPKDPHPLTGAQNPDARAHFRHETLSPTSNKGDNNVGSKLSSLAEDRPRGRGKPFPSPPKKDPTPASNKAQETFSASTKGNNHKRMPLPHAVKTSLSILAEAPQLLSVYAGSKGTGNRPSDSTNMKTSGSKHNSSNGSHHKSSSSSAKHMSTSKQVQATKKPPPSPNKAKGLENLPNGSQTHQIRVSDSSKSKGTGNAVIIPAKNKQGVMGASQKPQAATVPALSLRGLLNNVSSFSRWTKSAPPIDRHVQATNEPRQGDSRKPLASTHQAPKSSKGDGSSSKSHHAQILSLTSPGHKRTELSEKEVVLSTERVKNGPRDARDVSDKTNTSSGKMKAGKMATKLTFISSHATGSAKKSNERQSVRGSSTEATKSIVRRKKEFKVRSSSSNVLSQPPRKTSILPKGLLRQYSPTLVWQKSDRPKVISAYSTLTAAPLPSPPKNELQNTVARRTIARNPDLFKHTTPINVDAFEKNLKDHPNQPFVRSVVRSLRNGFWPWADTANHPLPTTYDGSHQRQPTTSKVKTDFIRQQRDEEVELERWSKPFGKKLLPGMHASPIAAVPKSTPGKYRLIIDQSRGPHALNSTIPKSQVKVKLDTIHDLGTTLIHVRKKHPKRKIVLIKSDVRSAFRLPPMHRLWQIKQAVSVDGQFHIDRCNTFGNRGGGWIWDSVMSLVNWIGIEKKKIPDLLGYVDDNFGWEFAGNTEYYKPYKKHMPAKQTRLLQLLDELGIPHDENKQLSGPSLPILGYEVDANAMTVKVPDEKKAKIIQSLRNYAHEGTSYTLKELQSVAGSTSAVLNLYPQLRPGLRGLFDEMAGKEEPSTKLMVTKPVARSLSKLADHLERAQPVHIQQKK